MVNIDFFLISVLGKLNEGDIPDVQNGIIDIRQRLLWPNGVVPFIISNSFSDDEKNLIRSSVDTISRAARCIQFVEHYSNPPRDHVSVIKQNGYVRNTD